MGFQLQVARGGVIEGEVGAQDFRVTDQINLIVAEMSFAIIEP